MNQSKQAWRAAMSEAVATVVSTATAAIRVAEANVRRARRAADLVAAGAVQETTMPGVYVVAATREYTADLNTGACTCPDQVNRGGVVQAPVGRVCGSAGALPARDREHSAGRAAGGLAQPG